MPEREGHGGGARPDLAAVHAALEAAHAEVLSDQGGHAEGLDGASCGPHMKHLAELAAAAAAAGGSASQWRAEVLTQAGPTSAGALDGAETCMRQAGLWPWNP